MSALGLGSCSNEAQQTTVTVGPQGQGTTSGQIANPNSVQVGKKGKLVFGADLSKSKLKNVTFNAASDNKDILSALSGLSAGSGGSSGGGGLGGVITGALTGETATTGGDGGNKWLLLAAGAVVVFILFKFLKR